MSETIHMTRGEAFPFHTNNSSKVPRFWLLVHVFGQLDHHHQTVPLSFPLTRYCLNGGELSYCLKPKMLSKTSWFFRYSLNLSATRFKIPEHFKNHMKKTYHSVPKSTLFQSAPVCAIVRFCALLCARCAASFFRGFFIKTTKNSAKRVDPVN